MDGLSGRLGILLPATPRPVRRMLSGTNSSVYPPVPVPVPGNILSGTAATPFLVAIPLGFSPVVIISLWTLLGGGGVLPPGRPIPIPIPLPLARPSDPDPDLEELGVELVVSPLPFPFHGK
jgi:hypothetical protein